MSDELANADATERADTRSPRRWLWAALALVAAVALTAVVLVATRTSETPKNYVCTDAGGPIFDVATPDEAFEVWWQSVGPTWAAQMTQAFPAMSVGAPVREDFVRSTGSGGTVGWAWEFAEGEMVSVSVSRVASSNGWMVAANRCSF